MSGDDDRSIRSLHAKADRLEAERIRALDDLVFKSVLFTSGERDPTAPPPEKSKPLPAGRRYLMHEDPRLIQMPARPTLFDFFRYRFGPAAHLLQSARLARQAGHSEPVVLACLLHDISVIGFIRSDHGYWGAQLVEPYVAEEVSWAIRMHQALRFYPDESVGYEYPDNYARWFGSDYRPDPYVDRDYQAARRHKWYMTARLVVLNDLYSFDPNVKVELDDFADIIGRHFRQPEEGLGYDNTPASHIWRTIIAPTKFL
jgi:hypothetical protein